MGLLIAKGSPGGELAPKATEGWLEECPFPKSLHPILYNK